MSLPRWCSAGRLLAVLVSAFAAVACDLVTAPKPGEGSVITVNYLGDTVLAVGTKIVLDASVTQGAAPIEGARLSLTSSDETIVDVTDVAVGADTIEIRGRGRARIRATLQGSSLGDDPPFAEVEIRGVAASIVVDDSLVVNFRNIGDSVVLRVSVYDINGNRIDSTADSWTSLNPAVVSVDARGKLLARANGTGINVRASVDTVSTTIPVTVRQRLANYLFTPSQLVVTALNQDTVVRATPLDAGGTPIPAGVTGVPSPVFTSLNTGVLTVTALTDTTFRVSSIANDTTSVRIVAGTLDVRFPITVGQVARTIAIQGAASPVMDALQDTVRLRARAFDIKNVEVQGRPIIWTSLNTTVATVDAAGLVTALSLGSVLVTSRMDASLDTVQITVLNLPATVRTSQVVQLPTVKDSVVLADTVLNKLGARLAGVPVSWRSLDPTIASVDATTGMLVAEAIGTTRIIGSLANGAADTTLVSVANRVAGVSMLHPDTTFSSLGDTATLRSDVRNARGAVLPASFASWSLTDSSVVSVSSGFVTALRAGFSRVIISDPLNPSRSDTALVVVSNAPELVTLNRVRDTLTAPTRTLQYVADVRNARGSLIQNPNVSWRSTNASVASVSPSGLATALAIGTTAVIAEAGTGAGLRADTALLVVSNDAVALTVSPTAFTIASVGGTTALAADARNAVGGSVTGVSFTWSSSNINVATVSPTGVVSGVAVGSVVVTAGLAGLTATADITVTNAPDTINIAPVSITMASVNDSVLPPAMLVNALGAVLPRAAAEWITNRSSVASVTPNGTIIAVGRGDAIITARNANDIARRDSVFVTVTNAPDSINVEQTLDSLPSLNRTLQYSAAVFNARRGLIPAEPVSWTSRNGSIATISATTGLATSTGIGSAYIVGTSGTVRDSALLVVSNFAATVQLTPGSIALASVGDAVTLTAVARNELGNVIASPAASWLSANPAVATVSSAGPAASVTVTAAATGNTTISATVDGVTQTVNVAVSNPPTVVDITSGPITLASIGDVATPTVNFRNSLNAVLPINSVLWTSSNTNVATVSGLGVITAIAAGTATITATSPASGALADNMLVTVTNAPVTLTVAPAGTTTLGALGQTVTFTATVRNAAGAVINNPAVSWTSNNAAVTVNLTTGVATAVANHPGVTITGTAGAAVNTATVAVGQAASGAHSTISASAPSITANGAATSVVTVQARDANGASLTGSGGTLTLQLTGTGSLGAVTNNNNGTYTATLTAPTAIGSGSISGSIAGQAITTGDPLVTYVAGAAFKYIVTTSGTTPVAGTTVTITAQQADVFNNPVTTAASVTWTSTGGGSFNPAPPAPVNASGIATVTFTTNTASLTTHNVTAATGGVTGVSPAIQTVAGTANNYLVTAATTSPAANSPVLITAQLRDINLNPVSLGGQVVAWTKSNINGSFSAASSPTNANGTATITLNTHTATGTATTVTATTGLASGISGTITTVPGVASSATTTITSSAGSVASGLTTALTVQLLDANLNALTASGGQVTLATTRGTIGAVTDNNNGTYSATFTGTSVGLAVISGTLAGSAITDVENVTVNVGTATQLTVNAGNGQSAFAGTAVAIAPSVLVRDAAGNPVPGIQVTFTPVTGAVLPVGAVTTGPLGIAALTSWTLAAAPGANSLNASTAAPALGPLAFTATGTAGPAATATTQITPGAGSISAGGSTLITVQLRDASSNNLNTSGGSVALSTTLGSLTSVSDNANGTYTATLSSSASGSATVTGTLNGAAITDNAVVTVNPATVSAAHSTASVPTGTAGSLTTITVQAKDAFGNNQPNNASAGTVLASVTGANTAAAAVADNSNGTYTITYTPSSSGADAIAITLGGVALGGSPFTSVVVAGAPSAAQSSATVPAGTSGLLTTISVRARDALGNNRTSTSGTVLANVTGANAIAAAVTDNSNGTYTVSYTPVNIGTDLIAITLGGVAIGGSPYSSLVGAGAVASFDVENVGGGAVPSPQTAGTPFNVRITARDVNGNVATSFAGTVQISGGPGTTVQTQPVTSGAFASGVLASQAVTVTSAGAGRRISVTRTTGTETGLSAAFTVNPGAADHLLFTVQPADAQAGVDIDPAVIVAIVDAFDNVVDDDATTITLTFANDASGGTAVLSGGGPVTAVNGLATFSVLSISVAANGYTLLATPSIAITTATSNAFNITP